MCVLAATADLQAAGKIADGAAIAQDDVRSVLASTGLRCHVKVLRKLP